MVDSKKYLVAFIITALIFGTAVLASQVLNDKKIEDVREIENRVALDILSSETQFALLAETSCKDIGPGFLSKELGPLGERLSYAENTGFNEEDVESLKRSYFLLEIKDYLLMKQLTLKCNIRPTFILYFYSSDEERCEDCEKMGFVLTAMRDKYPDLRVYSFDYHYDLGAIKTLISINKVKEQLPALIINGTPYYGFKTVEELEKNVPALKLLQTATSTATSTQRR
jgi:glutaredoxin